MGHAPTNGNGHGHDHDMRHGAQCLRIKCSEPAINTPKCLGRMLDFMEPYLVGQGVQIDMDDTGRPRWLSDPLVLPGLPRAYVANVEGGAFRTVVNLAMSQLIALHGPEIVFIFDHEHCGERMASWLSASGFDIPRDLESRKTDADLDSRMATAEAQMRANEPTLISETLNEFEILLRDWYSRRGGHGKLTVVKAVFLVQDTKVAARRKSPGVVTLDEYLAMNAVPHHPTPAPTNGVLVA